MIRTVVESSLIRAISYDANTKEMAVELRRGITYVYSGVPVFAYEGFLLARSKGAYFDKRISDRYPFVVKP